ncbi:MAG: hypothetical protein RLZZ500_105 [Bacteroidota bacterium]|jgi:hypothetical protein
MNYLNPNDKRGQYARIAVLIVLLISLGSIVSDYMQFQLIRAYENGARYDHEALQSNDTRQQFFVIVQLVFWIIAGIIFLHWFRRAYYNLIQQVTYTDETDSWAVWSWFIPIISLYKPYVLFKELFDKTTEYLRAQGEKVPNVPYLALGIWWSTLTIGRIIQNTARVIFRGDTLESLKMQTLFSILDAVLLIGSGLVLLFIMDRYQALERIFILYPKTNTETANPSTELEVNSNEENPTSDPNSVSE